MSRRTDHERTVLLAIQTAGSAKSDGLVSPLHTTLVLALLLLVSPHVIHTQAQQQPEAQAPECLREPLLDHVAVELAKAPRLPPAGEVERLVRTLGSDLPAISVRATANEQGIAAWLADYAQRGEGAIVCGRARRSSVNTEAGDLVLVAARRGGRLNVSDRTLTAELQSGFRSPRLVALYRDGTVAELARDGSALRPIEVREPTPLVVQLIGSTERGPRPVAEHWFAAPPRSLSAEVASIEDAASLLNHLRRQSGVGGVRAHASVARAATRHASAVLARGYPSHWMNGVGPDDRVLSERVASPFNGEAIGCAHDLASAFDGLWLSPSHREALTDRRFTDVGIGVASDTRRTCLVILLARFPRYAM